MKELEPIPLEEIRAARERLRKLVVRTPLVPLNRDRPGTEIYLKLENLQPIGSFKIRGAGNALLAASPERLRGGVYTTSAGNMAQGVAWHARRMGIPATAVVPDHAPHAKLLALEQLGMRVIKVPFDRWWQAVLEHRYPGLEGFFVHPVSDPAVIAGNGTIGLEILEDLPQVDAVVVPYGGGGLSAGIACAIRALKPSVRIFACEVDTAAPLAASLAAGSPQQVAYTPSFVDGIGSSSLLPEMWPLVRKVLAGSLVVTLQQVADAVRLLATANRVIAEGAGAAPVAAVLSGMAGEGKIVCVVSGGNIDPAKLAAILEGRPI
ncbi:L-threonine ammonia-lyase [bacterium HR33]|nr:L-threonine ammonia-lyase [bacterium HR33]